MEQGLLTQASEQYARWCVWVLEILSVLNIIACFSHQRSLVVFGAVIYLVNGLACNILVDLDEVKNSSSGMARIFRTMELLVVVPESLLTMTYASRWTGALAMAEYYGIFMVWSALIAVKLWLSSLAKSDVHCHEGDRRCGWTVLEPTASSPYQARFAIVPLNEHTTSRYVIPGNSVTLLSYVFGLGTSYRVSGVEVGPSAYG